MSMYTDSVIQPRRQPARYVDYPTSRSGDLSRVEVYRTEPISLPRRYADTDREARIVSRRPNRTRGSSSDSDHRTTRGRALVIRPRSTSRVQLLEPTFVAVDSSSDDEPRRRRGDRGGDHTRIRTTSRPGKKKKKEYALVRKPPKNRQATAPVVHDLELKTKPRHRTFQSRRADLENTEALVLVRARSLEREGLTDDSYSSADDDDEDIYDERKRQSRYLGQARRKHGSTNDGRREIVIARDSRDRKGSTRSQDSKLFSYGQGLVRADPEDLGLETRARKRTTTDLESVDSSRAGGGRRRASTLTARGQNPRPYRVDDDRLIDADTRIDPRRDSAYFTDTERRAKDRQWKAIDREKRALDREKAELEREQLLIDQEKRLPARDLPDVRRMSAADYLKQGDQYIKDGQKYYKTGQGLVSGVRNFLK